MLLAIDAGNTNIVFAVFQKDKVQGLWRCKTDTGRTSDEYLSFLSQLFEIENLKLEDVSAVIISSVVPDANFELSQFARKAFSCKPQFVGADIPNLGLRIDVDKPSEVGADRLVNAVAVLEYYKAPAVVVDFGTATTFDVVNKDSVFCGGVIAPGVNLSLAALHMAAAKLPKITIAQPTHAIGRNTIDAMQAGVFWGYVGVVQKMLQKITEELGAPPLVIATGGLATLFKDHIPE
ncbi:MAG: type III pantothenate kinase, partial [Pseudomonadota bacterium]